jgi:hypothetical protein
VPMPPPVLSLPARQAAISGLTIAARGVAGSITLSIPTTVQAGPGADGARVGREIGDEIEKRVPGILREVLRGGNQYGASIAGGVA